MDKQERLDREQYAHTVYKAVYTFETWRQWKQTRFDPYLQPVADKGIVTK